MIEYTIIGLARMRFALLGVFIWMVTMYGFILSGYSGFFDTLLELSIILPYGLNLVILGLCLDEYYWKKLLK